MAMRLPFFSMFMTSPFEGLQEHAEKVKECGWAFQQAIECHLSEKCKTFEEFRQEVIRLETDADAIKRRIRGHLPKGTLMPVYNFLLFRYLREQDQVIDAVEDALDWISFRPEPGIPTELEKDFVNLADAVIEPIEQLSEMVAEARKYFKNYSEAQRVVIKNIIHTLRQKEHEADEVEDVIKQKVLNMDIDAVTVFHIVRLAEIIGSIADHAENAGDMMRAMVAR
jgi:predicted phosphate transport protein (TIGR00153 family)